MKPQDKDWIEAKKRYRLTDAHIGMAKELGMNPRKFGSPGNHKQEPWKAPLPEFIEGLYFKRFGRKKPENTTKDSTAWSGSAGNGACLPLMLALGPEQHGLQRVSI